MKPDRARKLCWVTFALMATSVVIYGVVSVSHVMARLAVKPSVDLYANDLSFQVSIFVLLKGFPLLVLAAFLVFLQWKYLNNHVADDEEEQVKDQV